MKTILSLILFLLSVTASFAQPARGGAVTGPGGAGFSGFGSATNAVTIIMTNGVVIGTSITNLNFVSGTNILITATVNNNVVTLTFNTTGGGETVWTNTVDGFRSVALRPVSYDTNSGVMTLGLGYQMVTATNAEPFFSMTKTNGLGTETEIFQLYEGVDGPHFNMDAFAAWDIWLNRTNGFMTLPNGVSVSSNNVVRMYDTDNSAYSAIKSHATTLSNLTYILSDRAPSGTKVITATNNNDGTISVGFADVTSVAPLLTNSFGITIDNSGIPITTGEAGYVSIPYACTIVSATMMANTVGNCAINVWRTNSVGFPPTSNKKISAAASPVITATNWSRDSTLTGWITTLNDGDFIGFNVESNTTITRVTLSLKVTHAQ